ncbi:MAG: hypothetical protein ABIQ88_07800 [Chitinophagaceae bacterium]
MRILFCELMAVRFKIVFIELHSYENKEKKRNEDKSPWGNAKKNGEKRRRYLA